MNTQVLHYIGQGDLVARGDIAELRGDRVLFEDGAEQPFDLIVWATGYEVSLPFLERDVFEWRGTRPDLYLHQFHRSSSTTSRSWASSRSTPVPIPILSLQGRLLASAIEAQRSGGPLAERWERLRRERSRPLRRHPPRRLPRHDISIQDAAYQRHVRALLAELEPIPAAA